MSTSMCRDLGHVIIDIAHPQAVGHRPGVRDSGGSEGPALGDPPSRGHGTIIAA